MKYEKFLLSVFDKCIEITNNNIDNNSNNIDNGKILQIDIIDHNNHAMNGRKGFCYSKSMRLGKKDLLSVPPR